MHNCPECEEACYCGGDIDDIDAGDEEAQDNCTHCVGEQSCQDCGRLICVDVRSDSVDVIDRAYVTASGDLFCTRCGSKYDQAEEEAEEEDYFDSEWFDDLPL